MQHKIHLTKEVLVRVRNLWLLFCLFIICILLYAWSWLVGELEQNAREQNEKERHQLHSKSELHQHIPSVQLAPDSFKVYREGRGCFMLIWRMTNHPLAGGIKSIEIGRIFQGIWKMIDVDEKWDWVQDTALENSSLNRERRWDYLIMSDTLNIQYMWMNSVNHLRRWP